MAARTILFALLAGLVPAHASAESELTLTPHLGIVNESDLVNGAVRFSDGSMDFIAIEPDIGFLFGIELALQLRPKLSGVLGLSYALADARYDEDGTLRRDLGIATLRIQPGVMANVVDAGKTRLALGGGLTIARTSIDGMAWSGQGIEPRLMSIGLFGAAGLDVGITSRMAFHTHLALELNRPSYGDLEDELAFADGEASSRVDHDLRTGLVIVVGLAFAL